ncbi:Rne/Rng family ribonuclease [Novosphingobium sp. KACC 22771]|uniref:Rne/Rng family ribonuclease n=1 Tax=Novosphingobium sp. KACC 22771 TaxID=3025670 RepID=UPI002365E6BF|nr:ribonuclease E/G [Novosphingobium sp. KACC 22771]WDF71861.1 ribonuclease E/G [Novosphingobium sp. KACC 22771]
MSTRMLIDARHSEETRVAVLKGNRIEEFDFDSADHKQIKGNIYLAKVTRVEPSLQAAFVDFGGNRHGFLAFSEIHPDYYQIPKEDREALLAEEAAHAEEEAALRAVAEGEEDFVGDDELGEGLADDFAGGGVEETGSLIEVDTSEKNSVATIEAGHVEDGFDGEHEAEEASENEEGNERRGRRGRRQGGRNASHAKEAEELRAKRMALRRRYKIQDVIHRRQVLLVQVVKEERGNKGAALTSYLSLAGRYCVLMPNSSHGGGISRKISSFADRKRLKTIIAEMDLPKSMGCIVRTAGLQRTKTEIKRDFDYLARLWDDIRENTLKSAAPALIHSDSDLIKRAIRDIYNRDIEEVIVEGDDGYRAARDFMKLLMPSHARRVKHYADPVPLFQRFGAEDQLTAMYDPVVQLKSGGYIVINPTEALVSIDINSGRSTKEHGIEQTAVATNLEAAREIARQLRLRDMAGLVVIDFIDMEYGSNVRKVEKAMKEALKNDRARIQVGRISSFGLMEMSRQRLRTGVLEATTRSCPHCDGTGLVRTAGSAGLSALRLIEEEAAKGKGTIITLFASQEASIYLLNAKRIDLGEIEHRYGVSVEVIPEGENEGAKMRVVSSGPRNEFVPKFEPLVLEEDLEDLPEEDFEDEIEEEAEEAVEGETGGESADSRRKRRKRRRGRGRDRREDGTAEEGVTTEGAEPVEGEEGEEGDETEGDAEAQTETAEAGDEGPRKRRRRKRRRSRSRGEGEEGTAEEQAEAGDDEADAAPAVEAEAPVAAEVAAEPMVAAVVEPVAEAVIAPAEPVAEEAPAKPKRVRRKKADAAPAEAPVEAAPVEAAEEAPAKPKRVRRKKADAAPAEAPVEAAPVEVAEEAPAKPKRVRRKKADAAPAEAAVEAAPVEVAEAAPVEAPAETAPAAEDDASASPRRGWWQRTFGE